LLVETQGKMATVRRPVTADKKIDQPSIADQLGRMMKKQPQAQDCQQRRGCKQKPNL
jgi:hypothetical protein